VETVTDSRILCRTVVNNQRPQRVVAWEAMGRLAGAIALEHLEAPPAGLLIQLDAGDTPPDLEHMAPLAVSIAMAVRGLAYPREILLWGLVTPDGSIVRKTPERRVRASSEARRLTPVLGADIASVLRDLGTGESPASIEPLGEWPAVRDLYAIDLDRIREVLQSMLGMVHSGRVPTIPVPADWSQTSDRSEARLRTARVRNLDEFVTLALAGGYIRDAQRQIQFSDDRLPEFGRRVTRNPGSISGWQLAWITLLVTARVDGEDRIRSWTDVVPATAERAEALMIPADLLRARTARFAQMASDCWALLGANIAAKGRLPRSYPYNDPRTLAWIDDANAPTRAPVSDYGDALLRLHQLWAQLTVATVLQPEPILRSAEANTFRIADPRRLTDLLETAQKEARLNAARTALDSGAPLQEMSRILGRVRVDGYGAPAELLESLELLWLVSRLARETLWFQGVLQP
jgi:hypothetical protein